MVDGGRLPLRFALITFIIAFGAHWATKSHRVIGEFVGEDSSTPTVFLLSVEIQLKNSFVVAPPGFGRGHVFF